MATLRIDIDPIQEFSYELGCITSDFYYEIAVKALFKLPDYFYSVPASSSGKYHPKIDLGIGGLRRHTRAAFIMADTLLGHPTYSSLFTEDEKDEIRIAVMIHDGAKQGTGDIPEGHTRPDHPLLVRDLLKPWNSAEGYVNDEISSAWDRICSLVETHMGPWTSDKEGNVILQVPNTEAQKLVHLADFLGSRSGIEIDVFRREAQAGYIPPVRNNWRDMEAKQSQIDYLVLLYKMCGEKGIRVDPVVVRDSNSEIVLKRGVASDLIGELKGRLSIG